MNEDRAARYHRLSRTASVASVALGGLLLLALVLSGASASIRTWAADLSIRTIATPGLARTTAIAIYAALLFGMTEAVALPLAFYSSYILEHRYDLSRETLRTWVLDHLKAAAIGLVFSVAAAVMVYRIMDIWPRWWWMLSAAALSAFTVGLANLAPVVLFPLFFRFTPLTRDSLRARLTDLARRAGTPVVGVYEWSLGDKTRKANAALAGIGRTRRILVSDTLLADYSDDEIEVILAHELSHHVHHDVWTGLAFATALWFAGLYASHWLLQASMQTIGLTAIADLAGLPLVVIGTTAVSLILTPLGNAWSRAHEFRADRDALSLTDNHTAFVSAMRRLAAQNLAEDRPSRTVEILFHTHPPIARRIAAAELWQRQRPRILQQPVV